jgi:proline iminopeptidase
MARMYPPVEPYQHGLLDVGDGNEVYWETVGNPEGKPALVVHGGPGAGCSTSSRRLFDPARYRTVLFDQRGCGRSRPHASDPATVMHHNTTEHLLGDMEQLREHLGVDRWLLYGGSWGSTLILAYAERHPERVSEIIICGVTTSRHSEIEWLYRGVGRFFPEQWKRFREGARLAEGDDDVLAGYARRMEDPNHDVRARAAQDWCAWEDAIISLESFNSDFIVTHGSRSERAADGGRRATGSVKAEYYAEGIATVKMGFRVYDLANRSISDAHMFDHNAKGEATGSTVHSASGSRIATSPSPPGASVPSPSRPGR